ncbi:MAG: hypothetical protein H0X40_19420 [Chthoniobacterales bacterium]|nr:hypothetical protein [Chthoniobacterales bacterium]
MTTIHLLRVALLLSCTLLTAGASPANKIGAAAVSEANQQARAQDPSRRLEVEHFKVATYPLGMAFDGENIWVTNYNNITGERAFLIVLRASDGSLVRKIKAPYFSGHAAFDGTFIWTTDSYYESRSVTRYRLDGTIEGTYDIGLYDPYSILFDGENMWVASVDGVSVSKIRASDATVLAVYSIPSQGVLDFTYDGENLWISNYRDNTLVKLRGSDGAVLGVFTALDPLGITFDGTYIWVASSSQSALLKFDLAGNQLLKVSLPYAPVYLVSDGNELWVGGVGSVVMEVSLEGRVKRSVPVGPTPQSLLFDGQSIWVSLFYKGVVSKITPVQ